MQMLDLVKQIKNIKLKKSQILLLGSLLVFFGVMLLSWNKFIRLREAVYNSLKIEIVTSNKKGKKKVTSTAVAQNLPSDETPKEEQKKEIDYSQYLGVLEIPKIGLKRGFFDVNNKYNDIQYNVTVVRGSTMPDVEHGNLILMAHSGDAYISYFAYLYRLNIGDRASVTYNKNKYNYQIVNIYDVPKVGQVTINRNYDKTTLTLITCTKDNSQSQTIYILERV